MVIGEYNKTLVTVKLVDIVNTLLVHTLLGAIAMGHAEHKLCDCEQFFKFR